jgi:hypothetical protein
MVKAQYDIFLRHNGKLSGNLYRRAPGEFHEVAKQIVRSLIDYDAHFTWDSLTILAPSGRIVLTREQALKFIV